MPPELCLNKDLIKINENLKKVNDSENEIYISRLLPDNKIIVGIKSENKFNGYYFCPYMITCYDRDRNRIAMRAGCKLLREGAGFYSVITVG